MSGQGNHHTDYKNRKLADYFRSPEGRPMLASLNELLAKQNVGCRVEIKGEDQIRMTGKDEGPEQTLKILQSLAEKHYQNERGGVDALLDSTDINTAIMSAVNDNRMGEEFRSQAQRRNSAIKLAGTINPDKLKPKTAGQKPYFDILRDSAIDIGIANGPAGTGKTYLAVARAVLALARGEVDRIILTRPAVEAGEKLGFLPGDLGAKVDPYMRPIWDALHDFLGFDSTADLVEKGIIEVAPMAFMRGRTLNNSFVVLDEAQNTTWTQMKMFISRLGYQSRMAVCGDITQCDLEKKDESGLKELLSLISFAEERNLGTIMHKQMKRVELTSADAVRHDLVKDLLPVMDAYEEYREQQKRQRQPQGNHPQRN